MNPITRYNSFDALRAIMMLFGLVVHTIISYTTYTEGAFAGFFKDTTTSRFFDMLLWWIHLFRMPVFFVMAGFFADLVYQRKGKKAFWKNRLQRIVYPLIVGWIILVPILKLIFAFTKAVPDLGIKLAFKNALTETLLSPFGESPLHLWFLYFLILFYGLMQLIYALPNTFKIKLNTVFREIMSWKLRAVMFALITIIGLCFMSTGTFDTPKRFIPINIRVFIAYFYFFGFGVLLYKNSDLIQTLKKNTWIQFILSIILFAIHFYFVDLLQYAININTLNIVVASVSGGICCWLLVFSLTGIFLNNFEYENKYLRYMADASYWVYLAHLPVVIILIGILSLIQIPALIKCATILLITYFVLIVSYHFLVRKTFIGRFLTEVKNKNKD